MNIDMANLNDDELDALRVKILTEQERRANLARIPDQISDLCRTYRAGGGDPAVLEQAVTGNTDGQ